MKPESTLFTFNDGVRMPLVQNTLELSWLALDLLYGGTSDIHGLQTVVDTARHACRIDTSTEAGRSLAAIFLGYARRQFGDQAFTVTHISPRAEEQNR